MKLKLRARVVLSMVVAAVLANGVVFLTMRAVVSEGDLARLQAWRWDPRDLAACEAAPATWRVAVADAVTVYAYDPSGRSQNPEAPPLDPAFLASAEAQGGALQDAWGQRVLLQRVASRGSCAWLRMEMAPPPGSGAALRDGLVLGAGLALVLVTGLAILFVLQPLLQRIRRLRLAASGVGSPDYTPGTDDVGDALTQIGLVLDASHARVLAHEAELRERHQVLERHLAEIAHDLRTPLASLLLAAQEVTASTTGEAARAARRALDDAESMSALVDNLHQGTRLRQGLLATGQVDLCALVERLGTRFRALGANNGVSVEVAAPDGPLYARGAPDLAERAIANLVHNAVRHGAEGGHVALVLDRDGDTFELVVVDDGPGMRPDDLASLSHATFLQDPARRRGGGLGLAITNEVARRCGWQITYAPESPHGLRVTVRGAVVPPGSETA